MALNKFTRHSRPILKTRRWQTLRLAILERDNWRCRKCGASGKLEVDHVVPVRDAPQRAFDPSNLMALCRPCHSRKTKIEIGLGRFDPAREAWKTLLRKDMQRKTNRAERKYNA